MKGAVAYFEKDQTSCTFVICHLETKTLRFLTCGVTPIHDPQRDFAMSAQVFRTQRDFGIEIYDSDEVKLHIKKLIANVQIFFVCNRETFNLLTCVFNIVDKNIYNMSQKNCANHRSLHCSVCAVDRCAVDIVISITNFICNVGKAPNNIPLAAPEKPINVHVSQNYEADPDYAYVSTFTKLKFEETNSEEESD
jgi:hypothetical protein